MNNENETLGISIISTAPEAHQTNVNVNTSIEITFSGEINKSTLNNSIIVLEDYAGVYNGISSLKSKEQYNIVSGTISYGNRILTFKPKTAFNIDTRYIVVLNNTIQDIVGNRLLNQFVFAFNTEITPSYTKTIINSPAFGSILSIRPTIQWQSQQAPSYVLQISKAKTFEVLVFETFIVPTDNTLSTIEFISDIDYKEGVYYIRVKSEGGEWSDPCQFFYKPITDAVVSEEDESEEVYLDDFLAQVEEEIEILEMFPPDGSINNSLKINIFYIKIKGKLSEDKLSLLDFSVEGTAFDEEDDISYEHGDVNGAWTLIYDDLFDCTYVIFTPNVLTKIAGEN